MSTDQARAGALELRYPCPGHLLVRNSPANRVPSHGTHLFATTYSIDVVPVDPRGRSAPLRLTSFFRPEPPEIFPGFGWPVVAPISGTVVAASDEEADHASFRGLPSIGYALTQYRRAAAGGWPALAGNYLVIRQSPGGAFVALGHLRHGSIAVSVGDSVRADEQVAECGNSGNSTEPHVHLQAMDGPDAEIATGLPITFPGGLPRNGQVVRAS